MNRNFFNDVKSNEYLPNEIAQLDFSKSELTSQILELNACTLSLVEYLKRKFFEFLDQDFNESVFWVLYGIDYRRLKWAWYKTNCALLNDSQLNDRYQLNLEFDLEKHAANVEFYKKERCCSPCTVGQKQDQIMLLKARRYSTLKTKAELLFYDTQFHSDSFFNCNHEGYSKGDRKVFIDGFMNRREDCCEPMSDKELALYEERFSHQPETPEGWTEYWSLRLYRYPCGDCKRLGWGVGERIKFMAEKSAEAKRMFNIEPETQSVLPAADTVQLHDLQDESDNIVNKDGNRDLIPHSSCKYKSQDVQAVLYEVIVRTEYRCIFTNSNF